MKRIFYFPVGNEMDVILGRSETETKNPAGAGLFMRFFGLRPQNDNATESSATGHRSFGKAL